MERIVSIPYRYGITVSRQNGKQNFRHVSIPYRYGITYVTFKNNVFSN